MKAVSVLFATLVFSIGLFAQSGDPGAAQRFRLKFGRDITATQSATKKSCCRHKHAATDAATARPSDPGAAERFRLKFGRDVTAGQSPDKTAASSHECEMKCCD